MSRHRIFRFSLIALLVLAALFTAGILVVRSHAFHQYLLATIIEYAQQATGGRVELGDVAFRFWGLRADLYRVVVHGTEPDPQAPLFRADHLAADLTSYRSGGARSICRKSCWITLWSISGSTSKGTPIYRRHQPSQAEPVNIFDLAIGHFVLNDGEIYYNDRQIPLVAEVQDLQAQVSFDASKTGYDGMLGYRQGRVAFGDFAPLQHGFQARFNAAPSGLTLSPMVLTSGPLRITADVTS